MSKYFFYLILLFSTQLFSHEQILSSTQLTYLEEKKVIKMCVDPDWMPFEMINSKNEHIGIAADIIELLAKKLSLTIQLIPTKTWQETLEKSKNHECDILSLANQSPKREEWLTFTEPIIKDPNVLIAREEHHYIENIYDLKNHTIALLKDTAILERFQEDFPHIKILPVITEEEALELVHTKRADMTLRSLMVAGYTMKKENMYSMKIVGQPKGYTNLLRIGVRKDQPILRDIFNIGIADMTEEEQKQIINKYVSVKIETDPKNYQFFIYTIFILSIIAALFFIINHQLRKKIDREVQKNLENSTILFQQSKQAALGVLIGNISHQWRDSLTKISYINLNLRAHIIQKREIPYSFLDHSTQEIEETIDFMSETMQNFLEYYKPSTNIQKFDVYDSIKAVIRILDTSIKKLSTEISFTIVADASIQGIQNEWMQVWMNILSNTLNIVQKRSISYAKITIVINQNTVTFEDNCGGIEPSILKNINDEICQGLGIKICRDIITKYNGHLILTNKEEGAFYSIILDKNL